MEIPRPTQIGRPLSRVASRVRSTSFRAVAATLSRVPVTPISDAAYTNPREASQVSLRRRSVEEGATRKIRSRPAASLALIQGPASSGIRSGVITPDPPAAAMSAANASTPYRSMGFQYDMTRAAAPASATARTTANTSLGVVPAASARSAACWMTGPSMVGSE